LDSNGTVQAILLETNVDMTRTDVLRVLASFRSSHAEEFGLLRIGVFGSAARDHLTDLSDVDVVVELRQPDLLLLVGIKQELEELFDRPVDIVRYRSNMNPFLRARIEREAIYA